MNDTSREIKVLLVEDDEDDFVIIETLLKEVGELSIALDWESDSDEAIKKIVEQDHDVYVIDYRLGARTGLELLTEARAMGVDKPFVLLTGLGGSTLDRDAIDLGAADYLVKGEFDGRLLSRSIRYALDRHQSQRKLVDSEARYRLLFDANPEAVWVYELTSQRLLAANASASRFLGYSREELLLLKTSDMRSEEENLRYQGFRSQHVDSVGQPVAFGIWKYQQKNGRIVYADVLENNIDYEGQRACMVVAIDVSEKLAAHRALARQEEVFRKVLSDARDAIFVVSGDQEVFYANRAAEALFESTLRDLKSNPPLFPASAGPVFEWTYQTRAGRKINLEVQQSDTEWNERPARMLSVRDVSGQKDSQRELRLFKRALDCSYSGVIISDAQDPVLPIIYVNPAFERITGYAKDEIVGRNCRFLQGTERDELALEEVRLGLKQHRDVNVVLKNFRKDGTPFWNDLYISPILDEKGVVSHFVGVQNDVTERKRFEQELSYNASHDVLTGLPNRALFEDRLHQGCQISTRYGRRLAVLFVDLDQFKLINDSYGHEVGDALLVEVANRIKSSIRPGDTASRLGGDEYIVLLPDLAKDDDIVPVVERLMHAVGQTYHIRSFHLHVTPSIGIALSDGHMEDPVQLIQQADLAMYRAKEEGRNNYQWYTSDLNRQLMDRLKLQSELKNALKNDEFELHYQPKIDSQSGRVVGLEALLRWQHPESGLLFPGNFISVAEGSGLMVPLGQWVLDKACAQLSELQRDGLRGLTVAVNISPMQFQRVGFLENLRSVVEKYALSPGMLEIELTESVLIDNLDQTIACLHEVKKLGVSVSLDDFGTGYSSLSYLKRLPIDKIKIDRSFVRDIISDQHDAAITQAIIAMAHKLGLRVIAEGVETESQVAFLLKHHCDELQGYFFSRPKTFDDVKVFMSERNSVGLFLPAENKGAPLTLLLLDDEENILRALSRVLRRDGYKILLATKPRDAFELLAKNDVQVVISDQRMPEMSGTTFLSKVKDLYPDTVRIVLSGYSDLKTVTDAVNQGAIFKFLSKPWEDEQLRKEIAQGFVHAKSMRMRY